MDIGIGLPNTVSGATGAQMLDWARRADEAGFSSLATIGAVSYPSYEELTLFAAAAAVTERVRFLPNVMIAPARSSAELAKQAATVDQISGGRLTLGLGVGWRRADLALTGREFSNRGQLFDQQLEQLKIAWSGEALTEDSRPVSPPPVQNPIPILIGGTTAATLRRIVEHGVGWTAGGMPPDAVAEFSAKVKQAWSDAGREGSPRIVALGYFGLGDEENSKANIYDYYAPMGDDTANFIAANAMRSTDAIRGAVAAFEQAGVDEFIFDPSLSDPGQVDQLAEIVFG